jgi:tetratricopeptide (TPR) repeat protein
MLCHPCVLTHHGVSQRTEITQFISSQPLREAVAAYNEALQEFRRERVPLDWAATQNNLSNALVSLGQRESRMTHLMEAVAAYEEALKERTRERVPLDWARSTGSLGVVLMLIAERTGEVTNARSAVDKIEVALAALQGGGSVVDAARFEGVLPTAQSLLNRLSRSQ